MARGSRQIKVPVIVYEKAKALGEAYRKKGIERPLWELVQEINEIEVRIKPPKRGFGL